MDTELIHKIEAQRLELETNIASLRKSLHHWTALELDYEGLKDEFQTLDTDATKTDCLKVAHDFGPQKVDEKELNYLIEPTRGKIRSPFQLIELLSKRIDYVLRNTETLKKQISELEKKRNAVLLAAHPEHEAEAGLPLAEITEELDDDGNVLSSNVQQQGDTAKKVLEVLQKTNIHPVEGAIPHMGSSEVRVSRIQEIDSSEDDDTSTDSVSIARNSSTRLKTHSMSIDDRDLSSTEQYPQNPNDTDEEAQMRQEMINYGLGEVGNIVAELEFADAEAVGAEEEDEETMDGINEEEDEIYSDESMNEESEDESGRSRANIHTDRYRNRMEELQRQLGLKMENVGPSAETLPDPEPNQQIEYLRDPEFKEHVEHLPPDFRKRFKRPSAAEAAREAAIAREKAARSAPKALKDSENIEIEKSGKRKKVAFATTVDIAPDSSKANPTVMSDAIAEKPVIDVRSTIPDQPVKLSKFKATRSSQPQTALYPPPMEFPQRKGNDRSGPSGRTIAQTLVERTGPATAEDVPPPDDDNFDEELQKRQIALEHHQLRNRMVHEQGGYVKGGEADNWGDAYAAPEIEDEKTGQPVKISRFKAARLRP